jgi:LysM repeat protein
MQRLLLISLLILGFYSAKAQTTTIDYIEDRVAHAQELMRSHKIPASIILGIAIHESAAGQSKIAQYLNNHFGIKGQNSNTEIKSAYRDYPSIDSSYNHFITFLKSRTYFSKLFDQLDQYNYVGWAKGLQRGGYAGSRLWAGKLIALIKRYELYQYDERPDDYLEPAVVVTPLTKTVITKKSTYYTVKSGDNLSKIALKFKTTTSALMKKNGLKSTFLKPGQKLKI